MDVRVAYHWRITGWLSVSRGEGSKACQTGSEEAEEAEVGHVVGAKLLISEAIDWDGGWQRRDVCVKMK